uniref:Leucine-rich repeat-containing protein 51 n=1 Tax=Hemiselmis tepida TaxID=464990 RepID=A0A7S0W751_9CRYP
MSDESRAVVWRDFDKALANRSYVFQLDLSSQCLKKLPDDIGKLNKVTVVNLSQNDLNEASLGEEFFELHNLTSLDLSHNRFKHLPPCLCMFLELQRLDIRGNDFESPLAQADMVRDLFPSCDVVY